MAQENDTQKAPGDVAPDLPEEDVRTAVAHVIEVAAAFEGHGMAALMDEGETLAPLGWPEAARSKARTRDRKFLEQIVGLAREHRAEQRRRQRDSLLAHLAVVLTPPIKAYAEAARSKERELQKDKHRDVAQDDLRAAVAPMRAATREEVRAVLLTFYIELDDRELDVLVPELAQLKKLGGAAQAVEECMGMLAGLGQRWMHDIKMKPHVLDDARYPFGRWISRAVSARYAQELHDGILEKTDTARFRCADLEGLSEGLGLMQDRRVENVLRLLASDPDLVAAYLCRSIVDAVKQGVESADAPEELKALVTACIDACRRGDRDAARRIVRDLEAAVRPSAVAFAEQLSQLTESIVGPLATLPALPNGVMPNVNATLRAFFDAWLYEAYEEVEKKDAPEQG